MASIAKAVAMAVVLLTSPAAADEPECKASPGDTWTCPRALVLQWFRSHAQALPVCEAGLKRERADRETDHRLADAELRGCEKQVSTLERLIVAPPPASNTWRTVSIVAGVALAVLGTTFAAVESDRADVMVPSVIVAVGGAALAVVAAVDP